MGNNDKYFWGSREQRKIFGITGTRAENILGNKWFY